MLRLEELREERNLKQKEIAKILNVSSAIYSNWENEKVFIPTSRIYELANFYEVNIDYLLGLTNTRLKIKSSKNIDKLIVSKRCLEIRKDYNETLRQFVKRINTPNSTWSGYETGKTLILSAFLIEIAQKSNYSADWILGRSNIKYR